VVRCIEKFEIELKSEVGGMGQRADIRYLWIGGQAQGKVRAKQGQQPLQNLQPHAQSHKDQRPHVVIGQAL